VDGIQYYAYYNVLSEDRATRSRTFKTNGIFVGYLRPNARSTRLLTPETEFRAGIYAKIQNNLKMSTVRANTDQCAETLQTVHR